MSKKPYMPLSADGIGLMLAAFDTNINASGGTLAAKYKITAPEPARIHQASLVRAWFADALTVAHRHGMTGGSDASFNKKTIFCSHYACLQDTMHIAKRSVCQFSRGDIAR